MTATFTFQLIHNAQSMVLVLERDRGYGLEDKWQRTSGDNGILVSEGFVVTKPSGLACADEGDQHFTIVELLDASWDSSVGDTGTANAANKPGFPGKYDWELTARS